MKIGIGLPATIPGAAPDVTLDFARRADRGPFSSLGIIDRIAYGNYEPLTTLAAAAAVTGRIRLMTTILLAPARNAGVLAKQAATIDALSNGRLTLGFGVGGRDDDFLAAGAPFHDRGHRFEEQLQTMKRIWEGQPMSQGAKPVGSEPVQRGGPEILIGGDAPAALRRAARYADGYIATPSPPDVVQKTFAAFQEHWKAEGRSGRPRLVGGMYFALGPNAAKGADYILDYYGFLGEMAQNIAQAFPKTPEAVKGTIHAYADIGMDEMVFWPTVAEADQPDRLAEVAAAVGARP